jgi:DNA-binding IclR family transcriptional regulator
VERQVTAASAGEPENQPAAAIARTSSDSSLDPNSVLAKVMAVLQSFTADDSAIRLVELARRTGLPKGTLHRVCSDLVTARLLERSGEGYRLGGHLFELGMRASVERGLVDVATPFMEDLYELTHETVHLAVREASDAVYVAKIGGHQQAVAPSRVGGRLPLHCTAIGKVLLAHAPAEVVESYLSGILQRRTARTVIAPGLLRRQLEQIRETGVSYEFEESAVGIVCVATPVVDVDRSVTAALSVTGPVTRFDPRRHTTAVRAAAAGLQTTLSRRAALREEQTYR